jgi:hypothetical protein
MPISHRKIGQTNILRVGAVAICSTSQQLAARATRFVVQRRIEVPVARISKMSYLPLMQKGSLDAAPPDRHGKIAKQTVSLDGVSVTRVTFGVGARWSQDLKEYARTESCQLPHVALVLSGTLRVVMDDGSSEDFSRNEVMLLPPGHDAWTIGDEPCVFVEFSRGNDYYGTH